jgi:CheY-like chemotaxis protein
MARILLIDDDDLVAATIAAQLQWGGHEVHLATNGREGLDAHKAGTFDAVLLDLFMPEMEGLEFIRVLRGRGVATPIIAMTGGMGVGPKQKESTVDLYLDMTGKLGACATLRKPFGADALLSCVKACLETKSECRAGALSPHDAAHLPDSFASCHDRRA